MSTWNIKSSLEEWEFVAAAIEDELCDNGFSNKFILSLMLAMDEVIANIVTHAYKSGMGDVVVESVYNKEDNLKSAAITFIDYGEKFNPLEDAGEPDVGETDALKRKIGGLGIFLTKKQLDNLEYSYTDNANILTLVKKETI